MKILIINGSPRANGATGQALRFIGERLCGMGPDMHVQHIELGAYGIQPCSGCLACYKTGACHIQEDGVEALSCQIDACDCLVIGSPTYVGNVSGQMKLLIDRGHFVFEQLLRGKACYSVVTYENYGGKDAQRVINNLIRYSGGSVSGRYILKLNHGTRALTGKVQRAIGRECTRFYHRAKRGNPLSLMERVARFFIFTLGLRRHALRNRERYNAIHQLWARKGYV